MPLNAASLAKLKGVHPDLVKVIMRAAEVSKIPFVVSEGRRTLARQKVLLSQHATTTLRSRHLTGHAVDLVPTINGKSVWSWALYYKLAPVIKEVAKELHVPIEWGGDWHDFKDGPHFQLPWASYP